MSDKVISLSKGVYTLGSSTPVELELLEQDGNLDRSLLYQEPLCFINKSSVISMAKSTKQTRAMTAVDLWKPYLKNSITVFGYSSTALCRLLELLKQGEAEKPSLIIAMPSGFINTEYSLLHEAAKEGLLTENPDYEKGNRKPKYLKATG